MDTNKFFAILCIVLCLCFDVWSDNEYRLNKTLAKYDHIGCVYNDMIKVYKNGNCGFVNIKGKEVISPQKGYVDMGKKSNYYSNFCPLLVNDTIAIFSKKGKIIESDKIDNCDNYGIVYFQNKTGVVVEDKIKYHDYPWYWISASEKFYLYRCDDGENEYSLLCDDKGTKILKYDRIYFMYDSRTDSYISNKYFIVKNNNKYGVVDTKDHLIVPFKFDNNKFFLDGNYIVCNKSPESLIILALNGDTLSTIEYDKYSTYKNYIFGWRGLACEIICNNKSVDMFEFGKNNIIIKDSSYITINTLSNESAIEYFYIDRNLLIYKANGNYGIIDKKGKEILPCKYYQIDILTNSIIAYKTFGSLKSIVSLFDKKGICIKENLCYSSFLGKLNNGCVFSSLADNDTVFIWNDRKKILFDFENASFDCCNNENYCKIISDGKSRVIVVK